VIIDGILILVAAIIYTKYRDLRAEVSRLKQSHLQLSEKFRQQSITLQTLLASEPSKSPEQGIDASTEETEFPELTNEGTATAPTAAAPAEPVPEPVQQNNNAADTSAHMLPVNITSETRATEATPKAVTFSLDTFIAKNGLFWLGGLVLALGGVFLARYAIDAGLLPPAVRLALGAVFGIGLVVGAEFLSRHAERFNIHTPLLSASIASGGFITCFAMTYMAFANYQFVGVTTGFMLLSAIALLTMLFALKYGALLAAIGMLGAYAVPALVSTGESNILALLIYLSLISLASVFVANRVAKTWLWAGSFIAHFIWGFGAVLLADKQDQWLFLMFTIVSLYSYVGMAVLGLRLQYTMQQPLPIKTLLMPRKEQLGAIFPVLLISVFMLLSGFEWSHVFITSILSALLCAAAFRHSALDSWPYIALALAIVALFEIPVSDSFDDASALFSSMYLYVQTAVVAGLGFCFFMLYRFPQRFSYLLLLVLVPTSFYGISYVLTPQSISSFVYPYWTLQLLVIAALGFYLATKATQAMHKLTYVTLANSAITLCCTMLLSASTLTLALAAQITLMTILANKYQLSLPKWLFKIAVAAVLFRLTLAPWLPSYANETIFSLHFTLVLYPVVFALFYIAWQQQKARAIKQWLTGALLHLAALFVSTESSYLMTGEYPFGANMNFSALVILAMNWLVLAFVYAWRSQLANNSQKLYQLAACLLILGAGWVHLQLALFDNPWFHRVSVGEEPLINLLLPLYLVPTSLILASIKFNLVPKQLVKPVLVLAGLGVFLFVNASIRHAFNGEFIQLTRGVSDAMSQAELYTYSIVWLIIASSVIVVGKQRASRPVIQGGFIILAAVVLKVFLVDTAGLEGLYRALSYIILGLSLVAIGWLFQRLNAKVVEQG
jgi:uncharacterized membrane protein